MSVILIVEDDAFIREMAEVMIQDCGYETICASDVDEALVILRSPRLIDALFTDIYLKTAVLGGCELAQQAIVIRPDLRVLYTTGNVMTDGMRGMFLIGSEFLAKPYSQHQLRGSVEHLLAA